MARKLTKTIKSVNIGVVKHTLNLGNYNLGEVFGSSITKSSAVTGRLITGTGSTADVTESWTITLPVPEKYRFKSLLSVIGASAGAITGGHYSSAMDENGDEVVTFIANAAGASGSIANDEVVTIRWECYDDSTLNATIFSVKCQSDNAGHTATVKVRYTEGGTLHTHILFSGDTLDGPFAEVEVDALSNADASCFVYYQEH
jgi:hypothetical protein